MLALLLSAGCGQDDIRAYRVPKETAPPTAPPEMPAGHPDLSAPAPQLTWKTPAGWKELPAGEFRVASFQVTGPDGKLADVSVIPLPGAAGGDLSNVNRWRGQVGQPPVTAEAMKKLGEPVEVAGQTAMLYDQAGESTRILAAIQHRQGTAWFFKMTGDRQLVAQQKPVFVEFLKSFQLAASEATPPQPAADGSLPAGHPDIATAPAGASPTALSGAGKPK